MPAVAAPELPVNEGWRLVEEEVATPFDVRLVTVEAHTRVYEDAALREAAREAAGVDRLLRFVFASRLRLTPETRPSGPLRRLVTRRAREGFVDRLGDRGFDRVREAGSRDLQVGEAQGRLTRYEAVCRVDGLELGVEGLAAVWPVGTAFLLAGGAYPRSVRGEGERAAALESHVDPDRFHGELLDLVRGVE